MAAWPLYLTGPVTTRKSQDVGVLRFFSGRKIGHPHCRFEPVIGAVEVGELLRSKGEPVHAVLDFAQRRGNPVLLRLATRLGLIFAQASGEYGAGRSRANDNVVVFHRTPPSEA
jgi:hypothetical protein